MKFMRLLAVLLLVPLAPANAAPSQPTDAVPPLIYFIGPGGNGLNARLESLGILPAHGGDTEAKAKLLRPVACAGGPCRRLVEPFFANDPKWTSTALALEPTRAGRFAMFLISFDGWYLSISADMYDAKLGDSGKFEMTPRYFTIYNAFCAEDSDDCLRKELGLAFERIAPFWETRVDPEAWKPIAGKLAHREQLPPARELAAKGDAMCREQYGDYRVVKDFGDYQWLAFPPDYEHGKDTFVISGRCGIANR